MAVSEWFKRTPEYEMVSTYYEGKYAKKTGAAYMDHIDQGLEVLDAIGANMNTRLAFCMHPLLQGDEDLRRFNPRGQDPEIILLAVEYRAVANGHLLKHKLQDRDARPVLSVLDDVNTMLIADKVQNRKDFDKHLIDVHPHAEELTEYFAEWLEALGVSETQYQELANKI